MDRRSFVSSAGGAALAQSLSAAENARWYYEIVRITVRNGDQATRTADLVGNHFLPAWQRVNGGPAGFFRPAIGEESPSIIALLSYPSLAAFETLRGAVAADEAWRKAAAEYDSSGDLNYIRRESTLLRAFEGMPRIAMPPARSGGRVFELRTYESNNGTASARKIQMFNEGESRIFQRLGMAPVFFGENIVGRNLPSLTYMLTFDDLASREKLWGAFVADAEWKKLSGRPELADRLLVSNISNSILQPLPFSPIR